MRARVRVRVRVHVAIVHVTGSFVCIWLRMQLSPGMVFTQLLLDNSTPELRKFPFGVLAAQVCWRERDPACVDVCVRVCM